MSKTAEEKAEKALSGIAFGRLWCGICGSYDNGCGCGCIDPKEARSEREKSKAIEVVEKAIHEAEEAARRKAIEECLAYIKIDWMDSEGMLIVVDGKEFLDDIRSTFIEENKGGGKTCPE